MTAVAPVVAVRAWDELTREELYDALRLRAQVFVVEQRCVYLDLDGADASSHHVFARAGGALVGYARVLPPGIKYPEPSIGRVVTSPVARRTGAGRTVVRAAIDASRELHGGGPIRIGAQRYLESFYASFGFVVASQPYDEDGIPHVEMLLAAARHPAGTERSPGS